MEHPFRQRLRGGPILADGAMGTMLYAEGVDYRRSFEEQNLSQPDLVQAIHRNYIAAGAELIETNTFGGNRFKLAAHGLEGRVRDINYAGGKIARDAREVSGEQVFVAGSIGPSGLGLKPGVDVSEAALADAFKEQAEALAEGGVDLLILETFTDVTELATAIRAVQAISDLPIIAQLTFAEDLLTLAGQDIATVVATLKPLDIAALGTNCTIGPQGVLDVVEAMKPLTDLSLSAMPNAGFPKMVDGRYFYLTTPQYCADYTRLLLDAGVTIVGGCCGTTPQHIKLMHEALTTLRPVKTNRPAASVSVRPVSEEEEGGPTKGEHESQLAKKLAAGKFVTSVELGPSPGQQSRQGAGRSVHAQGAWGGLHQHWRQPDGPCAHERAGNGGAHPAASRYRGHHPLHEPGPEPDGYPVRPHRCARTGRSEHHRADRRPAPRRRLPKRHRCVGCGLHRPHQHPQEAERGPGRLRQLHRPGLPRSTSLAPSHLKRPT